MLITALLQTDVVVGADTGEHCHLFAPQAGRPAAPEVPKADFVGPDELASRPEILADHIPRWHRY
jgi:hypothetical protein